MVFCCLFLVSVSVTFHLMFVQIVLVQSRLMSGQLLTRRLSVCSLFCLLAILVISRFGFKGRIWVVISPVPGHCLCVTFIILL